ncbi:MAG: radical SAM protein [Chitinispirillaceae bacterium]|nr:radical SAM protein [Chitinispirillaceae bacterium]
MPSTTLAQMLNRKASAKNIPLSVVVEVTCRCNLGCYFCYQKHADKSAKNELSAAAWRRVFSQLAEAGTLYCTLSGGEPFVRKDILDIVEQARCYGMAVSMITNGTLVTRSIARALAGLGIMDIGVSLHAAEQPLHDRLAGKNGAFAAALRAIRRLKDAGVKVMIKHTVSKANFGQYRNLQMLADGEECLFECDAFVVPDRRGAVSPFALTLKEHAQFIRDMGAQAVFKGKKASLHCDAGRSVAGITPYGEVVPCIQLPLGFGSLRKTPFSRIWAGRKAKTFRAGEKRLHSECETCGIRRYCSRCHGIAWLETGDFRGKSPSCCIRAQAMRLYVLHDDREKKRLR